MLILATPPVPRESSNRRQESLGPENFAFYLENGFPPSPF